MGAQIGETNRLQRPFNAGRDLFIRETEVARAKGNLVIHAQVEEMSARILEDRADAFRHIRGETVEHVHICNRHRAIHFGRDGVGDNAHQHACQRGLATTRKPRDNQAFARLHIEGDVLQGRGCLVGNSEVADADHRLAKEER